ncbi:MAG: hypothetical protein U0414_43235 [Polyangiaceae bacterium]
MVIAIEGKPKLSRTGNVGTLTFTLSEGPPKEWKDALAVRKIEGLSPGNHVAVNGSELVVRAELDFLPGVLKELPAAIQAANHDYDTLVARKEAARKQAEREDAELQARFEAICREAGYGNGA